MAAVLRLALLTATSLPVLATDATECLMIGKVYEDVLMRLQNMREQLGVKVCRGFSQFFLEVCSVHLFENFLQDVSKQKAENVQKWEDCARACNQTDACSLFTYQPKSAFESTCWLIKVSRLTEHIFCLHNNDLKCTDSHLQSSEFVATCII